MGRESSTTLNARADTTFHWRSAGPSQAVLSASNGHRRRATALRDRARAPTVVVSEASTVGAGPAAALPTPPPLAPGPLQHLWADSVAGALACGIQDAVAYPLDTLKVRRQTGAPPFTAAQLPGLWRGCLPSAALRAAHGAAWLPAYGALKHALLSRGNSPLGAWRDHPAAPALAAGLAAAGATLVTAAVELPCEALLVRLKSNSAGGGSVRALWVTATASRTALASLWAGATPFILRAACYEAVEFLVYEGLKHRRQHQADGKAAAPAHAVAGWAAVAATAATVASHPLDVARVACAVHGAPTAAVATGAGGMMVGLLPRIGAMVPGALAFFMVYEATRDALVAAKEAKEAPFPSLAPASAAVPGACAPPAGPQVQPSGDRPRGVGSRRRKQMHAGFRCVAYSDRRGGPMMYTHLS